MRDRRPSARRLLALCWISLCWACTSVALPVVPAASDAGPTNRAVLKVTRDGCVIYGGKRMSVNELLAALALDQSGRTIEVHGDRDALWMHMQWVLAALGESGREEALLSLHGCRVAVAGRSTDGAVRVLLTRGLWQEKLHVLPDPLAERQPVHVVVEIVAVPRGKEETRAATAEYRFGYDPETATHDSTAIRARAEPRFQKLRDNQFAVGRVEASGAVSYRSVALALAALTEAGASELQVGLEALHPWDRDLRILPAPPHEDPILRWFVTDASLYVLRDLNLPFASRCERDVDADEDDRVIVDIGADGKIFHGGEALTLAQLPERLAERDLLSRRKLRRAGKREDEGTSDGRRWSRMYVLLRVDRHAQYQHALRVLAVLRNGGFYKVQIAATKFDERDRTPEEIERRWAGWEIMYPPPTLAGKLSCFLLTESGAPDEDFLDVHVDGSPPRFRFRTKTTRSQEKLARWLETARRSRGDRRTVGRIIASPTTPFGDVVAAVNSLTMAMFESITFADTDRAAGG